MSEKTPGKKRSIMSWLQFRLWHLLVLITIVAIGFGVYCEIESRTVEAENAVKEIEALGCKVEYESVGPAWLAERYRKRVVWVTIENKSVYFLTRSWTNGPRLRFAEEFPAVIEETYESLPMALGKFRHLRSLDFSETRGFNHLEFVKQFNPDWPLEELFIPAHMLVGDDHKLLGNYPALRTLTISFRPSPDRWAFDPPVDYSILKKLTRLETLDLSESSFGDNDLVYLANATELTSLDLSETHVHGSGLHYLSQLERLCTLDISHLPSFGFAWNPSDSGAFVDPQRLRHLGQLSLLVALEDLSIGGTVLDEASLMAIGRLPNLRRLDLRCCQLEGNWLAHLANSRLEEIDVSGATIDRACLRAICQLPHLRILNAECIDISAEDLAEELPQATELRELTLVLEAYSPRLKAVMKNLPHLERGSDPLAFPSPGSPFFEEQ